MSGGAVAYHLRENKAIERNLFVDLLTRIGRVTNISDYTYIGFGGPFLEDFKALHAALRINKMISIEMDENVCKRQAFNRPSTFVKLENLASGDFIRTHEFLRPTIMWLDFTAPKQLYSQLAEFQSLIGKLDLFDVAKLTLNANPSALGGASKVPLLHTERRQELVNRLGDFGNFALTDDSVLPKHYPATLLKAVRSCLNGQSTRASAEYFQILSAFVYKDSGHQMLTVTGVVLDARDDVAREDFLNRSRIQSWPFRNLDWSSPIEISVPTLSAKERMALDAVLPLPEAANAGDDLSAQLGYCPCEVSDISQTKELLANYAKFYRSYPLFSRVVL